MCSACAWTCELVAVTFDAYIHMYRQPVLNKAFTRLRCRVDGTLTWRIPHWQVGLQRRGCSSGVSMPWLWAAPGAPGSAMARRMPMSSPGLLGLDDPWQALPSSLPCSWPRPRPCVYTACAQAVALCSCGQRTREAPTGCGAHWQQVGVAGPRPSPVPFLFFLLQCSAPGLACLWLAQDTQTAATLQS
jgi:hypothetical protein